MFHMFFSDPIESQVEVLR